MKIRYFIAFVILVVAIQLAPLSAQTKLGDNAALRYWAAFAQMQDTTISSAQAEEMGAILKGNAPYDDAKYKDLIEKNEFALEMMSRGTALPNCDWGMDYQLGHETPVDYARKALILGRLNVLYVFHLTTVGKRDEAVEALASGLHFSQDIANGGPLFSTVIASSLLAAHLRAVDFVMQTKKLSPEQKIVLKKAIIRLGPDGLDWKSAMTRELNVQRKDWSGSVPLNRLIQSYVEVLNDESTLPKFQQLIASLPPELKNGIPNPRAVVESKRTLDEKLQQERAAFQ